MFAQTGNRPEPKFALHGPGLWALRALAKMGAMYDVYRPANADFFNIWLVPFPERPGSGVRIVDKDWQSDWRRYFRWYDRATCKEEEQKAQERIQSIWEIPYEDLPQGPARDHLLWMAREHHDVRGVSSNFLPDFVISEDGARYTPADWARKHGVALEYGPLKTQEVVA